MPKCIIDGKTVEFTPGQNLIEVAKNAGIEIPFFCYHPGLKIVAQCRMCYVEIGTPNKEGQVQMIPKLQTACSTPPTEGMVVVTNSEKVRKAQKATMEFLLVNHPLDCPICDKAGECDLQDNSFAYGDAYMRTTEERRMYLDLDMGPVIKKNMNRCIHCTRCIRFGDEVAGIREMVAIQRGNNTEITTIDGRALETDYAGNYADICPTGSLTLKDFRFKKRAWYLKKSPSVCEGCSKGCNLEIHHDAGVIYRTPPRVNMDINKWWLCDEGRFNYKYVNSTHRVSEPMIKEGGDFRSQDWDQAIDSAKALLQNKKPVILVGSDLSQEEAMILKEALPKYFGNAPIFHFGTPGIKGASDDAPLDRLLKRKSKTANLHGLEKLGFKGWTSLPAGVDSAIIIRGGRAVIPDLKGLKSKIGIGVFNRNEALQLDAVLPGLSWAEKEGTFINCDGKEQKFSRAILPVKKSKALSEIMMIWGNRKTSTGAA